MYIETVRGPIAPADLGRTLIHEHVLVDFIGAAGISRDRYDRDAAFRTILPHLRKVREQGFSAFVECTPHYIGRDPLLLRRLSEATGLHMLTNTGLYAAGQRDGAPEPYLPDYAYRLDAELLAGGWLKEHYEGIEATGIRPGFIKVGVNPGRMRPISEKIVRAAAVASRYSGLPIACHTGRGDSALRIVEILEEEQVAPERFIFVHAQSEKDLDLHQACARRGVWMEYDGIGPNSAAWHLELILAMLERGHEEKILISQDAGWYRPGEAGGGAFRPYDYLWEEFVPMMREAGVPEESIDHFLIHNPARALSMPSP